LEQFWKISDFAKQIKKPNGGSPHINTVDNWFKQLEERGIHCVSRTGNNEKVYDQLDLEIANFIQEKRDKKWALDVIFEEIIDQFELRPCNQEQESTSGSQIVDVESMKKEFLAAAQELAATQVAEVKKQYEEILRQLPPPKNEIEERQERITEIITRRRVETELEKEALHKWSTKPEEERVRRVGLFRKEEDRDKRDQFIKEYINEYFEKRLWREFDN
jgi:DNA-binding transcriptional MerR regulator